MYQPHSTTPTLLLLFSNLHHPRARLLSPTPPSNTSSKKFVVPKIYNDSFFFHHSLPIPSERVAPSSTKSHSELHPFVSFAFPFPPTSHPSHQPMTLKPPTHHPSIKRESKTSIFSERLPKEEKEEPILIKAFRLKNRIYKQRAQHKTLSFPPIIYLLPKSRSRKEKAAVTLTMVLKDNFLFTQKRRANKRV
jgi:hypothetical protein